MSESKNGLPTKVVGLPQVFLPSGDVDDYTSGVELFRVLALKLCVFNRGGTPVVIVKDDCGGASIQKLTPAAAVSEFSKHVRFMAHGVGANGEPVEKSRRCTKQQAELFLNTRDALELLPKLDGVRSLPILRFPSKKHYEGGTDLVVTPAGYDEPSRLYIVNGFEKEVDPSLEEAVKVFGSLFQDYIFASPGAEARAWMCALAALAHAGGLWSGRMPLIVLEAGVDGSQSGKGHYAEIVAAVMGEECTTITDQGRGSVGSISESIAYALFKGNPLILLDNVRGKVDSQTLESVTTPQKNFTGRVPNVGHVSIKPEKFVFFLTSNAAEMTRDLAKRSCIIQIEQRPVDFAWKVPKGKLVPLIMANPSKFLRAGFVILKAAHRKGWKMTSETRHPNTEFAQKYDYIGQYICGLAPLMDDHEAAQKRVSNPAETWARLLMLEVVRGGNLGQEMRAVVIGELCSDAGIEIPSMKDNGDSAARAKAVGSNMLKLFGRDEGKTVAEIEGGTITRKKVYETRDDGRGDREPWFYMFEVVAPVVTAPKVADVVTVPTRSIVPAPSVAPVVSRFGDDVAAAMSKDSPLAMVPDVASVAPDPADKLRITDQAIQAGAGDWGNPTSEVRMLELKGFMPSGRESVGTVARLLRLMRDRTPAEVRLTIDEGLRRKWWCSSLVPDPRNLKAEAKEFLSFPPQTIKPREAHHEHQEAEGLPF